MWEKIWFNLIFIVGLKYGFFGYVIDSLLVWIGIYKEIYKINLFRVLNEFEI